MFWKTKARVSALVYVAGLFVAANLGHGAAVEKETPVVQLSANHLAMREAEATARAQLDLFLSNVVTAEGVAHEQAAVKVAIPTDDGNAEIVWITPFAMLGGGQFVGILANAPRNIQESEEGDAVHFDHAQVRDWSFVGQDDKLYGSYTTRVLLPHLNSAQAEQIGAYLSDAPLPADW